MIKETINKLDGIDISQLTFADIRIMYKTHRTESSGSGRNKTYIPRFGCQTEIGDILIDIWRQLAEQLITVAGEDALFAHLLDFINSLPQVQYGMAETYRDKALELHMSRIFDNPAWVYFIPFNEFWRAEALVGVEIIEVIPSCCGKPGRITKSQIQNNNGENQTCCPHCGRFSTFESFKAAE